jgi:hypothetical protein
VYIADMLPILYQMIMLTNLMISMDQSSLQGMYIRQFIEAKNSVFEEIHKELKMNG